MTYPPQQAQWQANRRPSVGVSQWKIVIPVAAVIAICAAIGIALPDESAVAPTPRPVSSGTTESAPTAPAVPATSDPATSDPVSTPAAGQTTSPGRSARPGPTTKPPPNPPPPNPPAGVYYRNCDEVRRAGAAPLYRGQPGYRSGLDRDGDGVACEP